MGLNVRKPLSAKRDLETQTMLPQIKPRKQLTQPPQPVPSRIDMATNCIMPTIKPRSGLRIPQQQLPFQDVYQGYQDIDMDPYQQQLELVNVLQQQLQGYGPLLAYPIYPVSIDSSEQAKLQDLLDSGFINEAEFSERLQELRETEELIASLAGDTQVALEDFSEKYFPTDEASYAADGEALILDDFVSSFLLPGGYGSSMAPDDFISSSVKYVARISDCGPYANCCVLKACCMR